MRSYNHLDNRPLRRFLPLLLLGVPVQGASQSPESYASGRDYCVYVAAESEDRVDLVRFRPDGQHLVVMYKSLQAGGIVFWEADPS